jgi:hypothetical protein
MIMVQLLHLAAVYSLSSQAQNKFAMQTWYFRFLMIFPRKTLLMASCCTT